MPCSPELFLKAIAPYREDMAVAVECIFTWYWLADLCSKENIAFVPVGEISSRREGEAEL
jgi:hypothetical protein